jgi:hypothetical protein
MKTMKFRYVLLTFLVTALWGCGESGGPDPKVEAQRVEYAKSLRSYFDQAHGDYSQLTEADKAAFVKLSGNETKAEENWKLMKEGPGAASRGSR